MSMGMRKSTTSKKILYSEIAEHVVGVNMGFDFTAEHEVGMHDLADAFQVPLYDTTKSGLERRKIQALPSSEYLGNFGWVEDDKLKGFHFSRFKGNSILKSSEMRLWSTETLGTAWGEDSFGVISSDPKEQEQLKEIYDEFAKLNIVFASSHRSLGGDGGWMIAIADRIPIEIVDSWITTDQKAKRTFDFKKNSGIEELLKKAGKGYFALTCRETTPNNFEFWLNPTEQQQNNFGWFTLEDLKAWARNEGPIPIKKK